MDRRSGRLSGQQRRLALPVSLGEPPTFDAGFRWLPSLLEATLAAQVPEALKPNALKSFTARAIERLSSSPFFRLLPVAFGSGEKKRTILRLVIGVRFFTIIGHAGPGALRAALESETSDLMRAIDKLEILADTWWSYGRDVI